MGVVSSNKEVYPSKIECDGLFKVKLTVTAEPEDDKGAPKPAQQILLLQTR